ncbi:MAG: hypothetical protein IJ645_00920, partial [Ruminococcus sp.]|nr:hypothetical protein [Ruminococcus sp.]
MKNTNKLIAGVLAIVLSAASTGMYAAADTKADAKTDTKASADSKSDSKADAKDSKNEEFKLTAPTVKVKEYDGLVKDETVFVMTDPSGKQTKTIVSDWLKNPDGLKKLPDASDLTDIENVKTDESYTGSGDSMTWNTNGGDIYYKGYTDKEAPIDIKITYTLDGKKVDPTEIIGESGKLTVRYEYTNKAKKTVKIGNKNEEIYVPYLCATGLILDNEIFSNVKVTNARIISDGSRDIILGIGLPGMKKSLGLEDHDEIMMPEYFEITADVKNFEMKTSFTAVTNEVFSRFDVDYEDTLDEIEAKLDELTDAADKLVDGSSKLYDGIKTLNKSSGTLVNGIDQLYSGSNELNTGAQKLSSGAGQIKDGSAKLDSAAAQISNGLASAKNGSAALSDGAGKIAGGVGQLDIASKTLYDSLFSGDSSLASGVSALNKGAGQLYDSFYGKNNKNSLENGVSALNNGAGSLYYGLYGKDNTNSLSNGVSALNNGAGNLYYGLYGKDNQNSLANGVAALDQGSDQLYYGLYGKDNAQSLANGVAQLSAGVDQL